MFGQNLPSAYFLNSIIYWYYKVGTSPLLATRPPWVRPSKNWVTWGGGVLFLLERWDNPENRDGGWCKTGVVATFINLQFNCIYCTCVGKVKFPLLCFNYSVFWVNHVRFSSRSLYSTKTLYHFYISNPFW